MKFALGRGIVRVPQNPAIIVGFNNLRQLIALSKASRQAPQTVLRKQHQS
jgi:hypothetical protein